MSATMSILSFEITLILFIVVCVLFFFSWKRKKISTVEFEQLLDNVNNQQEERKTQLIQFLINDYGVEEDEATESGMYMVEAEKQFLQQFIKQQLEKTPVTPFYENLTELLDQYLYFVPKLNQDQKSDMNQERTTTEIEGSTGINAIEGDQQQETKPN